MALLTLQDVGVAFGGPPVLDRASLAIEAGDRVCLLGRNGAGKSTLLKLLDGSQLPDTGDVVRQTGVVVSQLEQDIPDNLSGTLFDVVASGLGELGELLRQYQQVSIAVAQRADDKTLRELDRLHQRVDVANAWQLHNRVTTVLERLDLDATLQFRNASGGRKRQTLLARALVRQPDVLLLDEPTNHLDINTIERLERLLVDEAMTLVFVTHDRAFLRAVATRIVEVDRGRVRDWGGDYDAYLLRKEASLDAESKEWSEFDRRLAEEETWIRTGIQARRTRNEGRVRALEAMRRDRSERRERTGNVKMAVQDGERSGRLVIDVQRISFAHGATPIVREFTAAIMRGDRIGLIGPNGVGKTTLVRLLLGELKPDAGTVRHGTNLDVAYFDQLRDQLDPQTTVFDAVADGAEFVEVGGQQRHVNGWLQDFLFTPDRARTPIAALSGGERNRLLLARLFTRAFNVLVLDEPTNDLDLETLDLLEERLLEFNGTLLVVSHDRAFLDAVVTSTLVFDGDGVVRDYVGGYADWLRQRPQPKPAAERKPAVAAAVRDEPRREKKRLSFNEKRELEQLPDRIDVSEERRSALYAQLAEPSTQRDGEAVLQATQALAVVDAELVQLLARWELLEGKASEG